MRIDQRNSGGSVTPTDGQYLLDRWQIQVSQTAKIYVQQNSGAVTPPTGFTNYLGANSSSSYSVTSSDYFVIEQRIEGNNIADLGFGTASARPVTLSFWVRSSLTGTFGCSFTNSGNSRSYPFTYTINSANTWEQKTITIPGDTSGTWLTTNGIGMTVHFSLGMGSTRSGTAGAWAAGNFLSVTGATSVVGTNGATWYVTGVQLEEGSTATSFEYRQFGTELALCQRYYAKFTYDGTGSEVLIGTGLQTSTTSGWLYIKYPVTMRSEPTASIATLRLSNFRSFSSPATLQAIYAGYDTAAINCTMGASGATDAPIFLQIENNTAGFLALSSEL
jgi:hypothetical protein